MRMKSTLAILTLLLATATVQGQASRHSLREGNRAYKKGNYDQAELNYRQAMERDTTDFRGQYNLGNSLYRQEKYSEAAQHYGQALASQSIDNHQRARTLHNMGNSLVKAGLANNEGGAGMQYFQQAVKSYQESLKLEPKDDDTRYNLSYARRLLQQAQQQQQQQGGGDNQQQQNKDNQQQNNKDQQQQQQDQQQGNQQQQQQNQQKDNDRQQKQQQAKPDNQKKQDAERMLEAVKNNERQTLKEQARKEQIRAGHTTDKDW